MLGDLVGEGGYAKAKSGFSAISGERVAAKIMTNTNREEHKREILTMSALKHPNIVELKDVIDMSGNTYLVRRSRSVSLAISSWTASMG